MVVIRFRRVGLKRQPSYRIVVTDKRKARDGKELEVIGHHNPRTRPSTDVIDEGRALYWLSVGAQPSDAVRRVMERTGTMERFQRLRKGEELDALVEEAQKAAEQAPEVDPRTAFLAPGPGEGKGPRAQERAAIQADATGTVEETVADVAEEAEAVADEAVEAAKAVAEDVDDVVEEVAEDVEAAVEKVAEDAEEVAEDAAEAAASAAEGAGDDAEEDATGDDEEEK